LGYYWVLLSGARCEVGGTWGCNGLRTFASRNGAARLVVAIEKMQVIIGVVVEELLDYGGRVDFKEARVQGRESGRVDEGCRCQCR